MSAWREPERLLSLVEVAVVDRPGVSQRPLAARSPDVRGVVRVDGPTLAISSTAIRDRVRRGEGRGDDWDHTLRAVGYARQLLRTEPGDPDIVLPALYLHDIGWSRVDYSDFTNAPPAQKKNADSVRLHMIRGAEMAAEILEEFGCDPEKSRAIVDIVAVHDDPEKPFQMNDPSAVIVAEADRLDRFGPDSIRRYARMFGRGLSWERGWRTPRPCAGPDSRPGSTPPRPGQWPKSWDGRRGGWISRFASRRQYPAARIPRVPFRRRLTACPHATVSWYTEVDRLTPR